MAEGNPKAAGGLARSVLGGQTFLKCHWPTGPDQSELTEPRGPEIRELRIGDVVEVRWVGQRQIDTGIRYVRKVFRVSVEYARSPSPPLGCLNDLPETTL